MKTSKKALVVTTDKIQVSVGNLCFSYDGLTVLADINLNITRGDFLAILGPNGSGKTTLLKIILGLLPFKTGQIKLFGEKLTCFSQWEKIGYVPQNRAHAGTFFPASVEEVVSMGILSSKKFPRFIAKKDKALVLKALSREILRFGLERTRWSPGNSVASPPKPHDR
ncbi:MAG: ATP-binding cassette domain-containing protein [Pseudomonadota bacterium]